MLSRLVPALVAGALLAGCSMGSAIPDPRLAATDGPGPGTALGEGTCWTGEVLDDLAVRLAATFGTTYFDAAYALDDRPSFRVARSCARSHQVEVYRLVAAEALGVTDYGSLVRARTPEFVQLSAAVERACMDVPLAAAAARSGVRSASLQPAVSVGYRLDWAPPTLEQWTAGQRSLACLFRQDRPGVLRHAALRTAALPTRLRTCIVSAARIYVDCARRHDREVVAVLDVTGAVAAGTFPGRSALRRTSGGEVYLDRGAAFYRPLDAACTAYLRTFSAERRLTGVAEIDVRRWPDADRRYRISCEAAAAPGRPPILTEGSVYSRAA